MPRCWSGSKSSARTDALLATVEGLLELLDLPLEVFYSIPQLINTWIDLFSNPHAKRRPRRVRAALGRIVELSHVCTSRSFFEVPDSKPFGVSGNPIDVHDLSVSAR